VAFKFSKLLKQIKEILGLQIWGDMKLCHKSSDDTVVNCILYFSLTAGNRYFYNPRLMLFDLSMYDKSY
jgi:hypothetical protein